MDLTLGSWENILHDEIEKEYFKKLMTFLDEEYASKIIYPERQNIFKALNLTSYEDVKVVIIGQDPYHEEGQAMGLAFSVPPGIKIPPSLKNIFKELNSELDIPIPISGDLTKWASQGVLLLNAVLTVQKGQANSHASSGWQTFTDSIIKELNKREDPIIFVLWGNNAIAKKPLIDTSKHHVLTSPHPSPLSAYHGFFGNGHFKKINEILVAQKKSPIDWTL